MANCSMSASIPERPVKSTSNRVDSVLGSMTMASAIRATAPLLLVIALSLAGCGGSTPAEHVAQAKALLAQDNFKAATIELNNALQQDPNLLEAR
ncbi:MAG: hypothetical protein IPM40_13795 [Gammaproteobacteria bacterium]|nr:hypothetical protein [Gammaproteobacteria bacterium]